MLRFVVTVYVPSLTKLVTPMMEAIRSFETSVLTRATCRNIPEDGLLYFFISLTWFSYRLKFHCRLPCSLYCDLAVFWLCYHAISLHVVRILIWFVHRVAAVSSPRNQISARQVHVLSHISVSWRKGLYPDWLIFAQERCMVICVKFGGTGGYWATTMAFDPTKQAESHWEPRLWYKITSVSINCVF
jgi:hypothetical protein